MAWDNSLTRALKEADIRVGRIKQNEEMADD